MAAVTAGTLVVFGLVLVALALFVTEAVSPDITAVGVLVALAVLEPVTGVGAADAISGFASPATVTIIAMYMLSEGVQRTGVVERLGAALGRVTRGDERRLLAATVGTTGLAAGVVNNTPVVAVFVPMVSGLAERAGVSRSKLLLPLSYAAMLGGTLTLVGTATNLLASDVARTLPGRGPIGMFEFTPLGVVVFLVGAAYLLTVGRWLTPARVPPNPDAAEAYGLDDRVARLAVHPRSALVGRAVDAVAGEFRAVADLHVDLLRVDRDGDSFHARGSDRVVEPADTLVVRASTREARVLARRFRLRRLPDGEVSETDLVAGTSTVVEAVLRPESRFVGQTVGESRLAGQYDTTVLAVLRDGAVLREELPALELRAGDTLLLYTTEDDAAYLEDRGDIAPTTPLAAPADEEGVPSLTAETPLALGIVAAVVGVAALGLLPVVIAALGGVVAMVVTGCLTPTDAYDAVSWTVVFLLAGILPLGIAMERTGGAAVVASVLVASAEVLPVLAVLALFYLLTGVLASLITPVASVVLMLPVAVDTATRIGADPFSVLLAVTFAGSAAFATPVGYQTNLMVYGPGGYRFTDYLRVGVPLQLLLAVVVPLGIAVLFGV